MRNIEVETMQTAFTQTAFIVPPASSDYLYAVPARGWSPWEQNALDRALQTGLFTCQGLESLWLWVE